MQSSNELYYLEHDLVYLKLKDENGNFFAAKLSCLKLAARTKRPRGILRFFRVVFLAMLSWVVYAQELTLGLSLKKRWEFLGWKQKISVQNEFRLPLLFPREGGWGDEFQKQSI